MFPWKMCTRQSLISRLQIAASHFNLYKDIMPVFLLDRCMVRFPTVPELFIMATLLLPRSKIISVFICTMMADNLIRLLSRPYPPLPLLLHYLIYGPWYLVPDGTLIDNSISCVTGWCNFSPYISSTLPSSFL